MNNLLKQIRSTLDTVEVKGSKNLDALLGCMNALDTLIAALDAVEQTPPEQPKEEKKEVADG